MKEVLKRVTKSLQQISDYYKKPVFFFLLDLVWCHFRYGVKRREYILFKFYKKSSLERKTFYTRGHKKYEKLLNSEKYHNVFWNKHEFNSVFSDFIKRDWLYCQTATEEEISNFIKKHKKVIIKPDSLEQGIGIHLYAGEPVKNLYTSTGGGYIIEDYIQQHPLLTELNSSSVNSVRVYTILDRNSIPHILSASLKVGGKGAVVDNAHSNGMIYPINIEHGIIMGPGVNYTGDSCFFHPGTTINMLGLEIPNWEKVIDVIKKASVMIPESRLIAWDIAILENDVEIIEGNYTGGKDLMQWPSDTGKLNEIKKYL